jgi:hypothetical protein
MSERLYHDSDTTNRVLNDVEAFADDVFQGLHHHIEMSYCHAPVEMMAYYVLRDRMNVLLADAAPELRDTFTKIDELVHAINGEAFTDGIRYVAALEPLRAHLRAKQARACPHCSPERPNRQCQTCRGYGYVKVETRS